MESFEQRKDKDEFRPGIHVVSIAQLSSEYIVLWSCRSVRQVGGVGRGPRAGLMCSTGRGPHGCDKCSYRKHARRGAKGAARRRRIEGILRFSKAGRRGGAVFVCLCGVGSLVCVCVCYCWVLWTDNNFAVRSILPSILLGRVVSW